MHIYVFSPIRYDYLHQRPQKLAERFLAMGATVTYVQPTGVRDLRSVKHPVRFLLKSLLYHLLALFSVLTPRKRRLAKRQDAERQFTLVSLPVTIPINRYNSAMLEALNAAVFRVFLRREIFGDEQHATAAIVENPFWGRVIERGDFERVCYDCLDDISIYAGRASLKRFEAYERMLIAIADVVVATARRLEARLREKTSKPVYRIPNGVDYEWFSTRAEAGSTPRDLAGMPRPIVGYVGSIAGWLDYELIVAVARLMPEVSFVFVGPAEHPGRVQQLQRSQNIFWLGRRAYEDVPVYIKALDVCSIPFLAGEIAQTTNPVKVFEYFALGKPVVSTPLSELEEYAKDRLVLFGDSPAAFAEALRQALAERNDERRTRRVQIAAAHSWRSHAQAFITALSNVERASA
jgi:glycosyltransferase involved in cell wall biosynthesis